jgi:hypothetical protein
MLAGITYQETVSGGSSEGVKEKISLLDREPCDRIF